MVRLLGRLSEFVFLGVINVIVVFIFGYGLDLAVPLLCDFASVPSIADPNPKAKHDRLVVRRHRISGACSDDKGLYYAHLSRRSRFATIPLPACYRCSSSYHPPPPPWSSFYLLLPFLLRILALP